MPSRICWKSDSYASSAKTAKVNGTRKHSTDKRRGSAGERMVFINNEDFTQTMLLRLFES